MQLDERNVLEFYMDEWLTWLLRKRSFAHRLLNAEDRTVMQLKSQMEIRGTLLGLIVIILMTLDMVLCKYVLKYIALAKRIFSKKYPPLRLSKIRTTAACETYDPDMFFF